MPAWFGRHYPSLEELEQHALDLGAPVHYGSYKAPACLWDMDGPLVIFVPAYSGVLARAWGVAHELGHLCLHHGPIHYMADKHEAEADAWAAKALIPEARVRHYRNASVGSFIGALHRHYQEIPPENVGIRALAARIALTRLNLLREAG